MAVRITEQRLPANTAAEDLGQSEGDAAAVLVSYHAAPVRRDRTQTYVVFVLDPATQGNAASYRWQVDGNATVTRHGVLEHVHAAEGTAQIAVDILDGGGATLKSLALSQQVVANNAELEDLITTPNEVAPVAEDPDTSREIVNDIRHDIDAAAPRSPGADEFNRLLFAVAYAEAMLLPPSERATRTDRLLSALTAGTAAAYAEAARGGVGLCQVRPSVLAMYLPATPGGTDWLIAPRILPADPGARAPSSRRSTPPSRRWTSRGGWTCSTCCAFPDPTSPPRHGCSTPSAPSSSRAVTGPRS